MQKRAVKIMATTLLVYALLVATHLGEFWPFSIYPMFSQGANPWTRTLVREVSDLEKQHWAVTDIASVHGTPVAMSQLGVDQIDLSNFVSKTTHWNERRLQGLRTMFGEDVISQKNLLVMKVNGLIHDDNQITVEAIPFLLLTSDSTYFNPTLPSDSYFEDR